MSYAQIWIAEFFVGVFLILFLIGLLELRDNLIAVQKLAESVKQKETVMEKVNERYDNFREASACEDLHVNYPPRSICEKCGKEARQCVGQMVLKTSGLFGLARSYDYAFVRWMTATAMSFEQIAVSDFDCPGIHEPPVGAK